jgi:hypothetical protein
MKEKSKYQLFQREGNPKAERFSGKKDTEGSSGVSQLKYID